METHTGSSRRQDRIGYVLTGAYNKTAPVGLTEYVTPVSVKWTEIMAAGTLVVIPVWVAALATQRYLVRGLSMGAVT